MWTEAEFDAANWRLGADGLADVIARPWTCDECGSGNHLRFADLKAIGGNGSVLVVCPSCREPLIL